MDADRTLKIYRMLEARFKDVIEKHRIHENSQQETVIEGLDGELYKTECGKRRRVFLNLPELGKFIYDRDCTSVQVKRIVEKHDAKGIVEVVGKNNEYRIPHHEALRIAIECGAKQRYIRKAGQKMQVWIVNTLKGGSGKTTTTAHLGVGLATEGNHVYRVGLIDLDPQGNLTTLMYPEFDSESDFSVGDIVMNEFELDEGESYQEFVSSCFKETNVPNVRILPAKELDNLFNLRTKESQNSGNYYRALEPLLKAVEDQFDIILIDTPPNINDIVIAAHYSADSVIMPLRPAQNDRDGTYKYLRTFSKVYESLVSYGHKGYDHIKVITVDGQTNSASDQELKREIWYAAGTCMLPDFNHSEAVKKCAMKGKTVFEISESEYSMKFDGKTLYGTKESLRSAQMNVRAIVTGLEASIQESWSLL
ncbi:MULTISPECIES: ParA family protein [Vibrio]|uniref:ParA family protein n=1 Tax=Vibrio TaxID=662 RepID=UPI0004DF1DB7|nr:ParA family protein [Vibrio parahaemolyticus]EGQ9240467.1 ParA family protein [Vibrio vulnificus]EHD1698842.1 ParA family protein [Vibrio vulnificus]EKZ9225792.1 ParA family protein [Vibrio vulnificus]ELC9582631.1 ParA family protein [Vibrio vulnificus]MCU8150205.1 ParA family protein [Vibrio vulnificus]